MLGNINHFLKKKTFSFLTNILKLKIVKYNKNIQAKLNISLTNYKLYSGRYIKYEKKGIGKEYLISDDKLIFEGEYLNGKRNGKGKEYYNDCKIKFEGEYLNGKKWNGIGYNTDKIIIYRLKDGNGYIKEFSEVTYKITSESEYFKGEKNGKAKEYDIEGKVNFEGEYKNGKKWDGKGYDRYHNIIYEIKEGKGYIKEYNSKNNKLSFEGEYLNGERNGKGKEYHYINGQLSFEGEYFCDLKNGQGKEYYENGKLKFEGEYLYNYKIKGKEFYNDKLEFEGEYLFNEKWNGKGYDENGNIIYELKNGNGKGKEYDIFGNLEFEGEYLNGKKWNGEIKIYNKKNGNLRFEGKLLNGKKNGKGIVYNSNYSSYGGEVIFVGEYLNGKEHGYGREYAGNRLMYEGEYKNGKLWMGKQYDFDGNIVFDGIFKYE